MEILCAYVRENASVSDLIPSVTLTTRSVPRTDIQTVVTVLGRRSKEQVAVEWARQFRLDLKGTELSGANFRNGDFSAAMFHRCRLEAAMFDGANLSATQFFGALLNHSDFHDAELRGTLFDHAIINKPKLHAGAMSDSLTMAKIKGISVAAADISAVNYLGEPDKMNLVFGSKDTILHHSLEFDRRKFESKIRDIRQLKKDGKLEDAKRLESELYQDGFVDWFPHDRTDLAFGHSFRQFLNRMKLHDWPYR